MKQTTNNQQPTTNHQPPTTNDQRPTTNDQRPTTNDQQPTTNNQQQPTTNNHNNNNKKKQRLQLQLQLLVSTTTTTTTATTTTTTTTTATTTTTTTTTNYYQIYNYNCNYTKLHITTLITLQHATTTFFVFGDVKFENFGSLAEFFRFWCCQVEKLRKSRRIVPFSTLSSSKNWGSLAAFLCCRDYVAKKTYGGQTVAVGCLLVRGSISTKLVSSVCRLHFQMSWWFE